MRTIHSAIASPISLPVSASTNAADENDNATKDAASISKASQYRLQQELAKGLPEMHEESDVRIYPSGFDPTSSFNNRLAGLSLYEFDEQ